MEKGKMIIDGVEIGSSFGSASSVDLTTVQNAPIDVELDYGDDIYDYITQHLPYSGMKLVDLLSVSFAMSMGINQRNEYFATQFQNNAFMDRQYTFEGDTDWNTCVTNGSYKISKLTGNNAPQASVQYGILCVFCALSGSFACLVQLYVSHSNEVFIRVCYDGRFNNWIKINVVS